MLMIANIEPYIECEFSARLEPLGFRWLGRRRWVRSQKSSIRELFTIQALKGGRYSPIWGLSTGIVPSFQGRAFRRQSTDKNAVMDLIIDPIDVTADVPPETFGFITGYDTDVPVTQIQKCAEHFVPIAMADFSRVYSFADFCDFFLERSVLKYRRFTFYMYLQHQLTQGFVQLLNAQSDDGIKTIQKFCDGMKVNFADRILSECIREAAGSAIVKVK